MSHEKRFTEEEVKNKVISLANAQMRILIIGNILYYKI